MFQNAASTVVALLYFLLDARWHIAHIADWNDLAPGERPAESWTDFAPIANDANTEIVANTLLLGASDNEVLQEPVDCQRQRFGLPTFRLLRIGDPSAIEPD